MKINASYIAANSFCKFFSRSSIFLFFLLLLYLSNAKLNSFQAILLIVLQCALLTMPQTLFGSSFLFLPGPVVNLLLGPRSLQIAAADELST